ncbi:HEAT repeat domain-containing protein [Brevibacillus choshinensis]|uniref:HEAT repeat domain-containing protein n=1 Tax=Brevibacillus choshinensis TaxID=54911 RepID=A0ABX7FTM2_BRECH|nr:HEAT repeat domain-containing protein [Brevibacillus choshinensis]QRG68997.1 HEAT repeat domain-containing protein [Brevibacillus choshinensis]
MIDLALIVILTVVFLLLLIVLYVYLVWRKYLNIRITKRKGEWLSNREEELKKYLLSGEHSRKLIPTQRYQYEVLEDYFSEYLSNFKLESEKDPIAVFAETVFVPVYKKRLQKGNWSTRMNTLYFIDLFRLKSMQGDLLSHLTSKKCSPEETHLIYNVLATFEFDQFQDLLKGSKELPPFHLSQIMSRLVDQDNLEGYVDRFEGFPLFLKKGILDVAREKNLRSEQLQQLLEGLLQDESTDQELRIRALKTIGSLGYLTSPEIITRMLETNVEDKKWNTSQSAAEKMMIARLMGNIKKDCFLPYLERLISDSGYIVRVEAAKSIRKYKHGKEKLQQIAASHADLYAREIAMEWMERGTEYE